MILKTERNKLNKILKRGWVSLVITKLNEKKVVDSKGKEYEKTFISHVFNGRNANEKIEDTIYEVAKEQKEKYAKKRVERKSILQ